VVLAAPTAFPKQQVEAGESNDELRAYVVLERWEKARRVAPQMHYTFTSTTIEEVAFWSKDTKEVPVSKGEVFVQWPDRLRIEIKDMSGALTLALVVNGRDARGYDFGKKVECVSLLRPNYRLPEATELCVDRSRLGFLSAIFEQMLWQTLGPPPQGLGRRFTSRMTKVDDHWSYIGLEPITRWGWFPDQDWQVVLHKKEHWLRRLKTGTTLVDFKKPDHKPLPPATWNPAYMNLPSSWTSQDLKVFDRLAG
jgi:hypothetical protein